MNEDDLKKILNGAEPPQPSEKAQENALAAAMAAFEENTKGKAARPRPTRINIINWILGEDAMNKKLVLKGTVAAVALLIGAGVAHHVFIERGKAVTDSGFEAVTQNAAGGAGEKFNLNKIVDMEQKKEAVLAADRTEPAQEPLSESERETGIAASQLPTSVDEIRANRAVPMGNRKARLAAPSAPAVMAEKADMSMAQGRALGYIGVDKDMQQVPQSQYVGEDEFQDFKINPVKLVKDEPVSTFSIDVDTASYAFVRRMINSGVLPQKDAVRVEEMINYFDYDYTVPESAQEPFAATVAVHASPWKAGNKLVHIGIKGHDIINAEKPRSNLVFLIDTSGSMDSPDKLPLAINALRMLVDELQPEDTIAIAVYAGAAGTVLEPTKVVDKSKILSALESLHAGGSTAGGEGIRLAYSLAAQHLDPNAVNRVILASDGDFNVGITDHDELQDFVEREREKGIFLSVLGFGQGNYHDNLMQRLAQNGNGNAAYIDTLNEARKVLVQEAGSTLFPIAKDVKLQVEFNPDMVSEYRLIGYETRILNREDFNNDKIDAGDIGSGHEVTAIYEITPKGSKNQLVDDLKYQTAQIEDSKLVSNDYATLKIRYKLPKEKESKLITRPVTLKDELDHCPVGSRCEPAAIPDDVRFSTAVAAFGQILKGGEHTGSYTLDDVITLAESAKGADKFGYRAEFINLVRLAKSAQGMQ